MTIDLPQLSRRESDSHKGTYGRALLVGGSRGMSGAISLAGMATLRSGAGLVTIAVPDVCLETVASFDACYMTQPLDCDEFGRIQLSAKDAIAKLAESSTCIGVGPGIGRSPELTTLVPWMYETISQPMVVDADALFALAQQPGRLANHAGPRIITPHPGEFQRLVSVNDSSREHLESQAKEMARENDIVIVLKGHRSLIASGASSAHNTTGNAGMSTGGSGDVLTGVITALVCQHLSAQDAARLGAHIHGLAGDLAAERLGQISMTARDLIDFLPNAFRSLET